MTKSPVAGILDSPGSGGTLTDGQVVRWAQSSGFTGDDLVKAVTIAFAEHRGTVKYEAIGGPNTDGTYDYGAWQINSQHKHLFAKYPQWFTASNGLMAKAVYDERGGGERGWSAWSAYNDKSVYNKYVDRGKNAVAAELVNLSPDGEVTARGQAKDATVSQANGILGIAQAISKAGSWMADQNNWARIGMVVVGGGLVLAGVSIAAKPLNATPAGKILKAVGGK